MPGLPTQFGGGALTAQSLATLNTLASMTFPTQGNIWFVQPGNPKASDTQNSGASPQSPFATLANALSMATANQNDIVYLIASSNTAGNTTDYQTATLNWNKDLVHLIGINANPLLSQRSRVAFAPTYNTASNLFTLSANDCIISNIEFFAGVAGTLPTGCMSVSGVRNRITRCHIAGMGNTANDISGAYSLQLNGAGENLIEDCTIGVDTIVLGSGTSNSQILFSNKGGVGCTRNWFRNCRTLLDTSSATACLFLRAGATSQDRWNAFEDCLFINSLGTTLTHAMNVAAGTSPSGIVMLTGSKTGLIGASGWNANSGVIYATGGPIPVAGTYGTSVAITS